MRVCWALILLSISVGSNGWTDTKQRKFNKNFLFGTATASFQVEGAWNIDGKGESIWDRFLHNNPDVLNGGNNGDIASDSYRLYKRDVEMLRELGVDYYRFSISWPRVLPVGFIYKQNEKGFEYYDNLINELLKYNIEPMVTLYHFDLPQTLQDLGGWANPLSVEWYLDYAKMIFDRYADRVKYFITFNQPNNVCSGYGKDTAAPGLKMSGLADYMCIKNVMVAHAKAYRLYEKKYKPTYKGSVGISLFLNWIDPIDNSTENVQATEEYREFMIGLYMDPIWSKEGDFPKTVKSIIARKSKEQGFPKSRLPELTTNEKKLLKGSADFLGVNHYTTFLIKKSTELFPMPSLDDDVSIEESHGEKWMPSQSRWLKSAPYGLYKLCIFINQRYDYPKLFITEHGWSTGRGLNDTTRVEVIRRYLAALLLAIEDGTECMGYTAWSLMDNVEWTAGTSERFGLYEVDFNSDNKTRTARLSALAFRRIIESRIVEDDWKPGTLKIDISDRGMKKKKLEL